MKSKLKSCASRAALGLVVAVASATGAYAGDLSGRVVSEEETSALEGAVVRIESLGRETTTDRDGRYRFIEVPAGDYTISVSYVGAADASGSVSVPATGAVAQDFTLAGLGEDRILVVGQRGSLYNALNQRRAADNIIDVLSSDAIGQFPDQNVSEAARRVAGVSVENDQGEGRFIVIRGFDPNLNASNVNGVRVPAPESDVRAVALDVIDSEVLEGIIVTKSLTPDLDADAIGGTIDIQTSSAFDRDGAFMSARIGGVYTESTEDLSPRIGLRASNIFADGQLGISGSLSYREREFATENLEVDGEWILEGDSLWNEEVELRDYIVTRKRTNAALNFDFRPNANTDLYLRTLFSDFEDQEYRRRVELKLDDADIVSAANDLVTFTSNGAEIGVDRDSKDRLETQEIWSVQAGGESRLDAWTLDYSLAFSHSEEDEPGSLDGVTFRHDYEDEGDIGLDSSDPLMPRIVRGVPGAIAFDDASLYDIDAWELVNGLTEDEELAARFNARRDFMWNGYDVFLQGGASIRDREKFYDLDLQIYEEGGVTLADFTLPGGVDYPFDPFGPAADSGAIRDFFFANIGSLDFQDEDSALDSAVESYDAEETINAAYLMGGVDTGRLSVVGGVRLEQTEFSSNSSRINEPEVGNPEIIPVTLNRDDEEWFPSVNARFELTDDILLRGAYYRAIARPTFGQLVPRLETEFEDDNGTPGDATDDIFSGGGGNPELQSQIAENFDLGVEWYTSNNGILSAGVFYKDIEDYIAEQQLIDVTRAGVFFEEFDTFINLGDASVTGLELNYQQALDMLPAPFDGLIVGANVTFLDGNATLTSEGRDVPLPKLSETLGNLVLGYQTDVLDLRLSYAYRDEYLDEINAGGDGVDRYVDAHGQLDFTAQFDLTDNVELFTELSNLTDEPFLAFVTAEDGRRALSQYEEYGYTAQFGVRVRR
ncbi:MAG: TonB-dependent receptor [Maricaulaceae bacterium]|jgi:TonB-dependent receptor